MTKSPQFRNGLGLMFGLVTLLLAGSLFGNQKDLLALLSGYLLFAINYLLLAKIYRVLILISQKEGDHGRAGIVATFATVFKFAGLICVLYLLLVKLSLSGFYLAIGSLGSLSVLTWLHVIAYFRSLTVSAEQ